MKTTELPKTIVIQFTEEDRQKAESFTDSCACLIVTALRRMGFRGQISEGVNITHIRGKRYKHRTFDPTRAKKDYDASEKPFYLPSVVGKKVTLKLAATP